MPGVGESHRDGGALLERGAELAGIDGLLAAACDGRGAVVVIEGPPGIGKSALLRVCAQRAAARGMESLQARGDDVSMESSFAAIRELLAPVADAGAFSGSAGLAAPVFQGEAEVAPEADRAIAVLHGLYWLIADRCDHRPVALLVDDAHWLDPASARTRRRERRRSDHSVQGHASGALGSDCHGVGARSRGMRLEQQQRRQYAFDLLHGRAVQRGDIERGRHEQRRGDDERRGGDDQRGGDGGNTAAPGTSLKTGQSATVPFATTLKSGKDGPAYKLSVQVQSMTKGTLADFNGIQLDATEKASTPYYVKAKITNLGPGKIATSDNDPGIQIEGVDKTGQTQQSVTFFGDFPKCDETSPPNSMGVGSSIETCLTFLVPGGITKVAYTGTESYIDKPVTWSP
jgi:hypothetical protein